MWKNVPTNEEEKFFNAELRKLGFKPWKFIGKNKFPIYRIGSTAHYISNTVGYLYATGRYAALNKDSSATMAAALVYARRAGKHIKLDESKIAARYQVDLAIIDKVIGDIDSKFADDFISGRIKI